MEMKAREEPEAKEEEVPAERGLPMAEAQAGEVMVPLTQAEEAAEAGLFAKCQAQVLQEKEDQGLY